MAETRIKVGIVGGAGYTGGELLRILANHPNADIALINSKSNAGKAIGAVHQDLFDLDLHFTDSENWANVDVVFLCAGHGEAVKFLSQHNLPESLKIIDLSHDFRLKEKSTVGNRTFVYGLPEINKSAIIEANNIANPGCFATAIQLGLLPLASEKVLEQVFTTGITGSTGAGQSLSATGHFSWRSNNIQAYKSLSHQHIGEIEESLAQLQGNTKAAVNFIPWRGDFARGIFISSTIKTSLSIDQLYNLYNEFYKTAPFTNVSTEAIHLKQVVNTNHCLIQLEKIGDTLVVHSVIDNLTKGASGQAVQNMNLMFGLDEKTGLRLKASTF